MGIGCPHDGIAEKPNRVTSDEATQDNSKGKRCVAGTTGRGHQEEDRIVVPIGVRKQAGDAECM